MSKGNTAENDVLKMVLKGTDPAWRTNANLYLSLHVGDPGEGGSQTTNECDYTGYLRVAIVKATGWSDAGSSFSNSGLIQFPQCTGGVADVASHVAIGTVDSPGAGQILYSGELNDDLSISNLIQPQFAIAALVVTED